jgi:thioredoxin-related protein
MKKLLLAFVLLLGWASNAQDWKLSMDEAQAQAKKENKSLVLVFQGSDWCAPCIKLDKSIWSTDVFKAYAQGHLVMVKADFPRKKANALAVQQQKHNQQLAERYNPQGYFPLVVVFNSDGQVTKTLGYANKSPREYIALMGLTH